MKKQAIEKLYSQKVAELLNQGWHINAGTMPGHQGEVAHVDLTDGSEIRRVLLEREMAWSRLDDGFHGDRVVIRVGRNTDRVYPGSWDSTIWNNHLETLFEIEFAEIQQPDRDHPDGWYTDFDEAVRVSKIRNSRRKARQVQSKRELTDSEWKVEYVEIALRWLKRTQKGFKSAKVTDITKVTRVNRTSWGTPTSELECYEIEAKGKTFRLCPPRKG